MEVITADDARNIVLSYKRIPVDNILSIIYEGIKTEAHKQNRIFNVPRTLIKDVPEDIKNMVLGQLGKNKYSVSDHHPKSDYWIEISW